MGSLPLAPAGASDGGDESRAPVVAPRDSMAEESGRPEAVAAEVRLLKARLALAKGKDFYLVLDASARTLTLELGGVPLRICPVEDLSLDRALDRARRQEEFRDSLAVPFLLVAREGTLPEVPPPVDVDTTAAAKKLREKELTDDITFTLGYDRDLMVCATTKAQPHVGFRGWWARMRVKARWMAMTRLPRRGFGRHDEPRAIFIQIQRADARALYRALPDGAGLALRL